MPEFCIEIAFYFEYAFVNCHDNLIRSHHLPPSILSGERILEVPRKKAINREELKKQRLLEALEQTNGNQSKAATLLGVSRVTVWNQMRRFGVSFDRKVNV